MAKYSKEQLENIQLDYGIVFVNHGETDERELGPTRGGATFEATQQIRDIEFDGRNGKTKGMQSIDFIDAVLKVVTLAISNNDLELAMPYLTKSGTDPDFTYKCTTANLGIVPNEQYLKNITVFGKKTGGDYIKIKLYNAMNEAPFSLAAVPKGEGTVSLEVYAHWESDETEALEDLFEITNVTSLA